MRNGWTDGADASVRVVNETSIASSAPRVTGDAGVGVRRLLTARPTKRARPNKKKKKAKGAIQVSPRTDGWNAAHPNANDYKILQTAVRNRGAFCPWMTRECVQPEAARTTVRWVKGNAYSCCQGDDRSCCSQRMPRMIPEPSVSRAEWCVRLDVFSPTAAYSLRPLSLSTLAHSFGGPERSLCDPRSSTPLSICAQGVTRVSRHAALLGCSQVRLAGLWDGIGRCERASSRTSLSHQGPAHTC